MALASPSVWIDSSILDWTPEYLSGTRQESERVLRPHEVLAHAYRLLADAPTSFELADALSNLKRAVDNRLRHLEKIYRFTAMFPKSIGALERLESVGLAKPFLIRALFDLRNDVEHNDATPPSYVRCRELADITWYFLKTTDNPCRTVPTGVVLRCEAGMYVRDPDLWLSVNLDERRGTGLSANGWLPVTYLYEKPQPGSLPLSLERQRSNSSNLYSDGSPVPSEGIAAHSERGDDETYVVGSIGADDGLKRRLWKLAIQSL